MAVSLFTDDLRVNAQNIVQRGGSSTLASYLLAEEQIARAALDQIESLWHALPAQAQRQFQPRITSFDDSLFMPTLFELLFSGYLRKREVVFAYEPATGGTTPDFSISTRWGRVASELVYVDITKLQRDSQRLLDHFAKTLMREFPTETMYVSANQLLPEDSDFASCLADIKNRTSDLDSGIPLRAGKNEIVGYVKRFGKSASSPGVNIFWTPADSNTYRKKLISKLSKKVNKAGNSTFNHDLFIIVACAGGLSLDDFTFQSALFGQLIAELQIENAASPQVKTSWRRDWSGFFTPNPGKDGEPLNTRVGAVLRATMNREPSGGWELLLNAYHNPFANKCLPAQVLGGIPQYVPDDGFSSSGLMKWVDKDHNQVF